MNARYCGHNQGPASPNARQWTGRAHYLLTHSLLSGGQGELAAAAAASTSLVCALLDSARSWPVHVCPGKGGKTQVTPSRARGPARPPEDVQGT